MKLKLVFLLCTLPMLFFVPYYYGYKTTGKTRIGGFNVVQNYLKGENLTKNTELNPEEYNQISPTSSLTTTFRQHHSAVMDETLFEKSKYTASNNKAIDYYVQKPLQPWPKDVKFPLIVHLHDKNEIAFSANIITKPRISNAYPAFNLAPALPADHVFADLSDNDKTSPEFVSNLVKDLLQQYPIDENRVYIIGCGYGAMGAFHEIDKNPDLYAGAITINGTWHQVSKSLIQTPLLIMHGESNKVFRPLNTRQFVKEAKQAGATIGYKEFESMGHTCSYKGLYAKNVWDWLFKQRKQSAIALK